MTADSAAFKWLGYQRDYLHDWSPRVNVNKSRRVGLSEAAASKCAQRAAGVRLYFDGRPPEIHKPVQQNIFSASKRQAVDLLERIVPHLRVLEKAHPRGKLIADDGKEVVTLTNGIKLKAFSTNSRTARGEWGDVLLDEYANVMRQDAVWKGVEAIAGRTPRNPQGYRIETISTPLGDDNRFYEISEGKLKEKFSQHRVTMARAMADGFLLLDDDGRVMTLDDFRAEKGDDELFEQEYGCSFLAASKRYIDATLYDAAAYDPADERGEGNVGGLFGGMDIGAGGHESVIVDLQMYADVLWQLAIADRKREKDWDKQEEWARKSMDRRQRFAMDSTGIGSMFGQRMEHAFPGIAESVNFTLKSKEELATGLRLALSRRKLRPLADDTDLRRDVLSLRRTITAVGNVRYDAEQTRTKHADGAWALALAVYAGGGAAIERLTHYRGATLPADSEVQTEVPRRKGAGRFGQMF